MADTNYNCECDAAYPAETLADLRVKLLARLGFGAVAPAAMTPLLNSFLAQAQTLLYRRYKLWRLERWYTWNLTAGTRFYDLDANRDTCTKKLDARQIAWVGVSQGDSQWRPLLAGIAPEFYTTQGGGIPEFYEIRQCIEVWPAPADDTWQLRIKGDFGLLPFAADTDSTTLDPEAIFLLALANAKAHYGQPDAANYMAELTTYLGDLTAGSHQTRRYLPGEVAAPPMVRPKLV